MNKEDINPQIRFKKEDGSDFPNWELSYLFQLADIVTEKNKESSIKRVFTNSAVQGVVDQETYFDKSIANKENIGGYYIVKKNDFVYNPRISSSAPVGPISINKIGTGIMSPLYTIFRFKKSNTIFFEHFFKTSVWHAYLKEKSSQGARHDRIAISAKDFKNMPIPIPDENEQQKIADCLSSLDELIQAETEKLEALQAHKKGLMHQLFPSEGETVPKLRFPEFQDSGEWEEKKLGDAADFINGKAYTKEELLTSGKYRVLRVGNFFTNNQWYYSDLELDEDKYCNNGDLLYAWSASFGPRIWKAEKVIYHYHIWKVVEKSNIDKQFLFVLLDFETENIKAAKSRGLGMQHLTKSGIESWESRIPQNKEEQKKIASCLSAVDEVITTQLETILQLKSLKKGLLQQLFPQLEP